MYTYRTMRSLFATIVLLALSPLVGHAQVLPPDDALVGFWRFNEPSGVILEDSSHNANVGLFQHGTDRAIASRNNVDELVASFDGIDDRIKIELVSADARDLTELTIQAWVYPTEYGGIIARAGNGALDRYSFGINEAGGLYFRSGFDEEIGAWHTADAVVPLRQWSKVTVSAHLVAADDATASPLPQFYLNDTPIPAVQTLTPRGTLIAEDGILYLGNNHDYVNRAEPGFTSVFDGDMDDVRLYNVALSLPKAPRSEVSTPDTPAPDAQPEQPETSTEATTAPVQPATVQTPPFCPLPARTVGSGARGDDVRNLQLYLASVGDYTHTVATGYFGALTQAAVRRFQCRSGIVCTGSPATTGYGLVGPQTRAALAPVCSGAPPSSTIPPTQADSARREALLTQIQNLLALVASLQEQITALQN